MGLETLFREIGQIYEAAQKSRVTLDGETKARIEKLPEIAAKLLLSGLSIELMDGDASCVPLTWVKAVFEHIEKLVPNQRVFTLSILGIQSTGKSTLLNTMFGLEFPVSAGRCTKGVYMQLVHVATESGLPFDYVVVVDTEGLRAPEVGDDTYNRDNEVATFVVGLGDATLMNIKGENVSEIEDILQIVIHAFLCMGIVNKAVQNLRVCLFIHQNVAAANAKDKMIYVCQQIKKKLDKMTEVAAYGEQLTNINSFNQIIIFDTNCHIWYFSDLWKGDPPMAPANPGYHEKVLELKSFIFTKLVDGRTIVTRFKHFATLIEDIWKGILCDDFVFSFKNTLAAQAYRRLEETLCSLSWKFQFEINEWSDKNIDHYFCQCDTANDLEDTKRKLLEEASTLIDKKKKEAFTELERFFEKDDHKEIMIEWKESKIQSLTSTVSEVQQNTKKSITEAMDIASCDLQQKNKDSQLKQEIFKKATSLALEMKGKDCKEETLNERFEQMWNSSTEDFKLNTEATVKDIRPEVLQIVHKNFFASSRYFTEDLQKSISDKTTLAEIWKGEDIDSGDISIVKSNSNTLEGSSETSEEQEWQKTQKAAKNETSAILGQIEQHLNRFRNSSKKFQPQYANEVLQMVKEEIKSSNSKAERNGFAIRPALEAKLVSHILNYAIPIWEGMQKEYDETKSLKAKRNKFKEEMKQMYKSKVKDSTEEFNFTELLCSKLEQIVSDAVEQQIGTKVAKEVALQINHKYNLIKLILTDLANKEQLDDYIAYITDAKTFAEKWLKQFFEKFIFDKIDSGTTKYAKHAEIIIASLTDIFEHNLLMAKGAKSTKEWLSILLKKVGLPETENLEQFDIKSFDNLNRLLDKKIPEMRENVLEVFKNTTSDGVKWKGEPPYTKVTHGLWGCVEQCPFCKEPCQFDREHSSHDHQSIQHRPGGASGWRHRHIGNMVIENCSYNVQGSASFSCLCSPTCQPDETSKDSLLLGLLIGRVYHPCKEYKKYHPKWNIHPSPNMDSSHYWLWFIVTFESQLVQHYGYGPPEIPDSWKNITKRKAIDSLSVYDG